MTDAPTPTMERDSLVARLTEALKPFAQYFNAIPSEWPDISIVWGAGKITTYAAGENTERKWVAVTAGDFRRAYDAYDEAAAALSRPEQVVTLCDCERGHNGIGMVGRECDCQPPINDGWQAEAEAQASALAERAGIDMLDDHGEFIADLESTLIEFAEWGARRSCLTTAAPLRADASAPASPAIGVQAVTTVDDIAKIIDPHSFLPDNSGDDLIGEMVKNGMEDARSKARRILSALHPAPEAASAGEAGIDEATMGRRWRVFEAIQHGWWGIEIDGDEEPLLYPIKTARETLSRLVDIHNTALSVASKVKHPAPEAASAGGAEETDQRIAVEICDAVMAWMVRHELIDSDQEYHPAEIIDALEGVFTDPALPNAGPPSDTAPSPKGVSDGVREALVDLVSWFDGGPSSYGPWIIKAGPYGADDAVEAARAALSQEPAPGRKESQ